MQPTPALPDIGTVLNGKYRLLRILGKGGAGQVVEAEHLRLRTSVALKFMLPNVASDPDTVARFEREARAMARIASRHVVRVFDVETTEDGIPFVVMELLSGTDLHAHLRVVRTVEPLEAVRIIHSATLGVMAMHQAGVVHRDLKPANLFLAKEGEEEIVKVVDFGISKIVGEGEDVTQVGASMGTPSYMSPEQVMSTRDVDHRTDVWSLGIILFRMIAGRPPFEQVGSSSMVGLILMAEPTPLTEAMPGAPKAVEAIIKRALAKEPADRYPSAEAFATALADYAEIEGAAVPRSLRGNTWRNVGEGTLGSGLRVSAVPPPSSHVIPALSTPLPEIEGAPPTEPSYVIGPAEPGTFTQPSPGSRSSARLPMIAGGCLLAVAAAGTLFILAGRRKPETIAKLPASTRASGASASAASPAALPASPSAPPSASAAAATACPAGMARVPAGKFFMGVDELKAMDREKPRHQVMLASFCIDITEVTVDAYKLASDQGEAMAAPTEVLWPKITPAERKSYDGVCNAGQAGRGSHPINCVSWTMAETYCKSQKKRLPTSAEWEYASRGPDGRMYPWGNEMPGAERLNACGKECVAWGKTHGVLLRGFHQEDDGFATTAPVGSFPKGRSRYGLDDVIGNVMEWVQDWDAAYTAEAVTNPQGPDTGTERVIRGGAWNAESDIWVRPSFRFSFPPETRSHGVGFRCAATP